MANNYTAQDSTGATITICATDSTGSGGPKIPNFRITDAVNGSFMPTLSNAATAGFMQITDGSATMPVGNSIGNSIFHAITDKTNAILSGAAANLTNTSNTKNALMVVRTGQWVKTSNPGVNVAASASQSNAGANTYNVCQAISVRLVAGAVAPAAATATVNLRDGATGVGTILATWTLAIPATAGANDHFELTDLNIMGSANTAMTLEFTAGAGANTFESCTLIGTTAQ